MISQYHNFILKQTFVYDIKTTSKHFEFHNISLVHDFFEKLEILFHIKQYQL